MFHESVCLATKSGNLPGMFLKLCINALQTLRLKLCASALQTATICCLVNFNSIALQTLSTCCLENANFIAAAHVTLSKNFRALRFKRESSSLHPTAA